MAKKTLKAFTRERFQEEVAQELGINLSEAAPRRGKRAAGQPAPAPAARPAEPAPNPER